MEKKLKPLPKIQAKEKSWNFKGMKRPPFGRSNLSSRFVSHPTSSKETPKGMVEIKLYAKVGGNKEVKKKHRQASNDWMNKALNW